MAASLVQTKSGNGGGYVNSYSLAFTSNVTAGSLLVLAVTAGNDNSIGSISDDRGNTWNLAASVGIASGRKTWLYYVENASAGATTATITFGASQYVDSATIMREYSGIATSSSLDKFASTGDTNYDQSQSSGSTATTTQANELIIGACGATDSTTVFSAGTNFGNAVSQGGSDAYTATGMEDRVVSATGTYDATFTTDKFVQGTAIVATFKEPSSSPTIHNLLLMGVGS